MTQLPPQEWDDDPIYHLLGYDGLQWVMRNGWYVQFQARIADITDGRPYGLKYSLTLHDENRRRLLGYDNAHGYRKLRAAAHDHRHAFRRTMEVEAYEFRDAFTLIDDFLVSVKSVCEQEGVDPQLLTRRHVELDTIYEDEDDE